MQEPYPLLRDLNRHQLRLLEMYSIIARVVFDHDTINFSRYFVSPDFMPFDGPDFSGPTAKLEFASHLSYVS